MVFFFKGTSVQHPYDKACTEAFLTAALQLLQLPGPSLLTGETAQYPQVSFTELNWNNSGTRIISQKLLRRIQVLYRWFNCCFFLLLPIFLLILTPQNTKPSLPSASTATLSKPHESDTFRVKKQLFNRREKKEISNSWKRVEVKFVLVGEILGRDWQLKVQLNISPSWSLSLR